VQEAGIGKPMREATQARGYEAAEEQRKDLPALRKVKRAVAKEPTDGIILTKFGRVAVPFTSSSAVGVWATVSPG